MRPAGRRAGAGAGTWDPASASRRSADSGESRGRVSGISDSRLPPLLRGFVAALGLGPADHGADQPTVMVARDRDAAQCDPLFAQFGVDAVVSAAGLVLDGAWRDPAPAGHLVHTGPGLGQQARPDTQTTKTPGG